MLNRVRCHSMLVVLFDVFFGVSVLFDDLLCSCSVNKCSVRRPDFSNVCSMFGERRSMPVPIFRENWGGKGLKWPLGPCGGPSW